MANLYRCDIYMHSEYSFNAPSERTSFYFARGSRLTWCKLIQSETQFALSFLYWSTICPKYSVVKSHFRLKAQTNKVRFMCSILNLKSDPEPKVVFFIKCDVFFKSPNLQKQIIPNHHLKFPANNSKQQIQICVYILKETVNLLILVKICKYISTCVLFNTDQTFNFLKTNFLFW